jgi:transaldolase
MTPTQALNAAGQSIWLDNITRPMLDDATLTGYIDELHVTGLTSNPTIFDKAIASCASYDDQIAEVGSDGSTTDEQVFFALAIDDLRRAADEFAEVYERTAHADGFVSLEVSPELAFDTAGGTIAQARDLCERTERPNVFIKIPGTKEGLPAITQAIH